MNRWRAALPVCVACGLALLSGVSACGGGKPAESQASAAGGKSASAAPKADDWCDPMPQPDDACTQELKECMVTCDYISDRCALVVCMGSKWTYVEEDDESKSK